MIRILLLATFALAAAMGLSGCGYNDFQRLDEQTKGEKAGW